MLYAYPVVAGHRTPDGLRIESILASNRGEGERVLRALKTPAGHERVRAIIRAQYPDVDTTFAGLDIIQPRDQRGLRDTGYPYEVHVQRRALPGDLWGFKQGSWVGAVDAEHAVMIARRLHASDDRLRVAVYQRGVKGLRLLIENGQPTPSAPDALATLFR